MGKHTFKCLVCGREQRQNFSGKYFSVPYNSERRSKWLKSINKSHLIEKKISRDWRVCELHFKEEMYSKSKLRLKWSATPFLDISNNVFNMKEGENTGVKPKKTESAPINEHTQALEVFDVLMEEVSDLFIEPEADDHLNKSVPAKTFDNSVDDSIEHTYEGIPVEYISEVSVEQMETASNNPFKETAENSPLPNENSIEVPSANINQLPPTLPSQDDNEIASLDTCSNTCKDEYDMFGNFVASELRGLRTNVSLMRSVKKKIQLAILDAYESFNSANTESIPLSSTNDPLDTSKPNNVDVVEVKNEILDDGLDGDVASTSRTSQPLNVDDVQVKNEILDEDIEDDVTRMPPTSNPSQPYPPVYFDDVKVKIEILDDDLKTMMSTNHPSQPCQNLHLYDVKVKNEILSEDIKDDVTCMPQISQPLLSDNVKAEANFFEEDCEIVIIDGESHIIKSEDLS